MKLRDSTSIAVHVAVIAGCVAAQLCPTRVSAQSAAPPTSDSVGLEEIVVSATRRETRLNDTPISVEAFTQERMDVQGLRNIDDISRLTPGLSFQRMGLSATSNYNDENSDIAIRGIESTAGASTTGIYVDDTPIQTRHLSFGTVNAFPQLFDLDRVEVLRGPQGTLFGAGSEGGTVRFITPEPGLEEFTGYARSELAFTKNGAPSYEEGAAVGGPIINGVLGFRISANYRSDGGWVDRVAYNPSTFQVLGTTDANSNWQDTTTVRAALKFAPTDNLTISPSFYYQKLYLHDTAAYWPLLSNPGGGTFNNGNVQPNSSYDPFYLAATKLDWHLGGVELVSSTSYFSRDQRATTDYTQLDRAIFLPTPFPAPGDIGTARFTDSQDNFVQEVRLQSDDAAARLTWVIGAFYMHARENTTEFIADPTLDAEVGGFNPPPFPGGVIYAQPLYLQIDKQLALYGQGDYKLTDAWKLTLGLRVANVTTEGQQFYDGPFVGAVPATAVGSDTEHPVTPKIGLSYQIERDHLLYASAAKGYRIGGLNASLGQLCAGDLANFGLTSTPPNFKPDSLWSYELGAKDTFLDGRLQINSSLYYITWKDIQQNVYLQSCALQFTANLGAAVSKGGDIQAQFRATGSLLLGLDFAYTDAKYTETVRGGTTDFGKPIVSDGDRLPGAPWVANLSAEYDLKEIGGRRPYVRVDYQVSDAQQGLLALQDLNNGNSDPTIPSFPEIKSLAMRAGVRWSGLDISLFGNNLLDSHPLLITSHDTLASPLYFDHTVRPRTIGVTGTYRF